MYHDYMTISLVNKLKKTFNLLSSLCVLIVDLRCQVSNASVQMIGSLSTNEENYMEWPGGDKMNILRIVWRVFLFLILRQLDFS